MHSIYSLSDEIVPNEVTETNCYYNRNRFVRLVFSWYSSVISQLIPAGYLNIPHRKNLIAAIHNLATLVMLKFV